MWITLLISCGSDGNNTPSPKAQKDIQNIFFTYPKRLFFVTR